MRRAASIPPELNGYEFVKPLGTGGFSDVYLYEQKLPRRKVAVKVLLLDELNDATRASFVSEANVMAQLSAHPYIVSIFHADVAGDGRPYFVMEYCSGPSLGERYKRETFGVADALRTGVRLSSAIATAHGAGILHRDIKPANVLTNDYGWPALTDFGISSTVEGEIPTHTMTGSLGGGTGTAGTTESQSVGMSVPWSPPEMFEDDPQPDVRSDVFALAATIHTLLAGRTPFEIPGRSNGTLDLIGRIERGSITPIGRDDIPRSLTAVLQKGMASKRVDRFASAVEFARALQRVELELGYSPTTIEVPNIDVAPVERPAAGGEDETRVRSVSTIAAQPVVAPTPIAAPTSNADETQVRGMQSVAQVAAPASGAVSAPSAPGGDAGLLGETVVRVKKPTASEPVGMQPVMADAPTAKRGLLVVIASIVAVLVIGGVIAAALLFGKTPTIDDPAKTAAPPTGGSAVVGGGTPRPTEGSATLSADGATVTYTWVNPAPEDGDTFRFAFSELPGDVKPTADPQVAAVTRPVTGGTQCVDAFNNRAGKISEPLTICFPEVP